MPTTILIVDDSELIVSMLSMVCQQLGHQTTSAGTLDEVPALVAATPPDAILCDLNIPGVSDPVAALKTLPSLKDTPIILISGTPQDKLDQIAEERGADAAISKDGGMPAIMTLLGPTLSILLAAR